VSLLFTDSNSIAQWAPSVRGVFSKADLQSLLADPHPNSFYRRLRNLEAAAVLTRATRGFYVTKDCSLPVLSQRICERSYVSFGTVLAEALVVGTRPERQLMAVKVGKSRDYKTPAGRIVHLGVEEELFFGFETKDALFYALPEKALLDVLYFHVRGRRFPFDIYSDLNLAPLDRKRLASFLARYSNPRFVAFVENLLHG
jgi:hypothetical protein